MKHAQLIEQSGDMPIDGIFDDRILLGTNRVGDISSRERMVWPTGQKEQNAKLDDA